MSSDDDGPPAPPTPTEPVDRTLGAETGVVSVAPSLSAAENAAGWVASVLSARRDVVPGHPLGAVRDAAEVAVPELGVPGRRVESWRFTDLRSVYDSRYVSADSCVADVDSWARFDVRRYVPDTAGVVLVFVDGVFDAGRSMMNDDSAKQLVEAGGYIGDFAGYGGDAAAVVEMLTSRELGSEDGGLFPSLGNAIASDAAVIHVPAGLSVSRPVAVLFVNTGGASTSHAAVSATRLAVVADTGSKVTLLESHASLDASASSYALTLSSSAVAVADNAFVSHYHVNNCSVDAHVISSAHANVAEGGVYEIRMLGLGCKVNRMTLGVDLEGPRAHGLVHGSLISNGYQIADLHSRIQHNAVATTSNQLQKNIAADHGRAIFNGKIIVTKEGQQTDSQQLCRSMLLSNKAYIDAMPVLEIKADDVKCTHGATIADLNDDELFYCQSRGLSLQQSQRLLISGFAVDVIGDCPFPTIRSLVEEVIDEVATTVGATPRDAESKRVHASI